MENKFVIVVHQLCICGKKVKNISIYCCTRKQKNKIKTSCYFHVETGMDWTLIE